MRTLRLQVDDLNAVRQKFGTCRLQPVAELQVRTNIRPQPHHVTVWERTIANTHCGTLSESRHMTYGTVLTTWYLKLVKPIHGFKLSLRT